MESSKTTRQPPRRAAPGREKSPPRWSDAALDRDEQYWMRREALLKTAAKAFNENGYYNTSVDDLARILNVTKPTLYYYINSKDEILFECQRKACEFIRDALEEAQREQGSGLEKLTTFLARHAEMQVSDFGACLVRTGLKPLAAESREKLLVFAKQLEHTLQNIIARGVADGSIRSCDPKLVSFAILGGFNAIANWYRPDGELPLPDITQAFLDLYLRGLQPAGHEGS